MHPFFIYPNRLDSWYDYWRAGRDASLPQMEITVGTAIPFSIRRAGILRFGCEDGDGEVPWLLVLARLLRLRLLLRTVRFLGYLGLSGTIRSFRTCFVRNPSGCLFVNVIFRNKTPVSSSYWSSISFFVTTDFFVCDLTASDGDGDDGAADESIPLFFLLLFLSFRRRSLARNPFGGGGRWC